MIDSAARTRLGHALTSAMRADMTSEGVNEFDIEKRVANSLRRMDEAPVIILLCRDVTAVREHKREDEIMAIQSVANAATYLLLAVHAEGPAEIGSAGRFTRRKNSCRIGVAGDMGAAGDVFCWVRG